ncbi:pre-mRNA-splicing factor CWC25 homolog isoform X2 [Parasteatoda tepidariorum]|uniref:pre-mRNA-splicing factor CWC25 homolog isoform X1 n=1 Tax=Parasteatoda tepidariorum TaxID=114398 RepID=UPI001C72844F|nr:pre-mRNA-splicing factor CWC25 homolog isoform X1 [Parasteatoda tepidariorum]XP_042903325.1 pre-mRNA-splicing factor CWC25 homolog isoform X2 [Parasteatoda tepidariorum]XP_042903326.1 pre-mRNA-splicing factor CWC25 homolog isoform X1 [Parasteatoda tepidariorum]XP_042903327.1 pre-mRNA-splicing factor CWC25 homolog isoform X2 [Parasteatoda tepidariorum]
MGGGDLNLKKSWHPSTLRNIERVWKAEQKHEAEKQKIEQLQKELAAERAREEIQLYAEDQGVVKKKEEKLDWMYQGPAAMVNREEYLLGRKIDKTFETLQQIESGKAPEEADNDVGSSMFSSQNLSGTATVDLATKIREDPLFNIMKKEKEQKKNLLSNPVKMKQLQQLLQASLKTKSKKSKKSKKKKHQDDGSDDEVVQKRKKHQYNDSDDEAVQKRKKHQYNDSDDEVVQKRKKHQYIDSEHEVVQKRRKHQYNDSDEEVVQKRGKHQYNDSEEEVVQKRRKHQYNDSEEEVVLKRRKHQYNDSEEEVVQKRNKNKDPKKFSDYKHHGRSPDYKASKYDDEEGDNRQYSSSSYNRRELSHRTHNTSNDKQAYPVSNYRDDNKRSKSRSEYSSSQEYHHHRDSDRYQRDDSQKSRDYHNKSNQLESSGSAPKKKLDEKERERLLREMQENAKWREDQRKKNATRYKEEEERENKMKKVDSSDFMKPMLAKVAGKGSVESRVKQKIFTIQRSSAAMDRNFARRD